MEMSQARNDQKRSSQAPYPDHTVSKGASRLPGARRGHRTRARARREEDTRSRHPGELGLQEAAVGSKAKQSEPTHHTLGALGKGGPPQECPLENLT